MYAKIIYTFDTKYLHDNAKKTRKPCGCGQIPYGGTEETLKIDKRWDSPSRMLRYALCNPVKLTRFEKTALPSKLAITLHFDQFPSELATNFFQIRWQELFFSPFIAWLLAWLVNTLRYLIHASPPAYIHM